MSVVVNDGDDDNDASDRSTPSPEWRHRANAADSNILPTLSSYFLDDARLPQLLSSLLCLLNLRRRPTLPFWMTSKTTGRSRRRCRRRCHPRGIRRMSRSHHCHSHVHKMTYKTTNATTARSLMFASTVARSCGVPPIPADDREDRQSRTPTGALIVRPATSTSSRLSWSSP
jgi:hypothetical protein